MSDAQRPPESLADELAQLRATLAAQQQELTAQRALIAQQQVDIAALRSESASADAVEVDDVSGVEAPARPRKTSRRNLLVGAAGVAAAATAAAATVVISEPQVAHAATGGNLILGASNDAGVTTTLSNTTGTAPSTMFEVDVSEPGSFAYAIYATAFTGVYAGAKPATKPKSSKKASLEGAPIAAAIAGFGGADAGNAVTAAGKAMPGSGSGGGTGGGSGGAAIIGVADLGYGVEAVSINSIDLVMDGSGRMWQYPQGYTGAPTGGSFNAGESIRDGNGELWLCVAGGSPGTWVKVAHLAPGVTSGGAINYLSKPIRLLDTRNGQPALYQPKAPYANPSTHTITVSGVTYNSVLVPTTCVGAIGNLTIIGGSGNGGYVALVPSGAGFSGTANIAYVSGQVVSNSYNVGLSATGALDIILGGGTSGADVILDLFAVVS